MTGIGRSRGSRSREGHQRAAAMRRQALRCAGPLIAMLAGLAAERSAHAQQEEDRNPAQEEGCYNALQCRVGTDEAGTDTTWEVERARYLCDGTQDWEGTVECFKNQIARHLNLDQAIGVCRMDYALFSEHPAGTITPVHVVNKGESERYLYFIGEHTDGTLTAGEPSTLSETIPAKSERDIELNLGGLSGRVFNYILVLEDKAKFDNLQVKEALQHARDVFRSIGGSNTHTVLSAFRRAAGESDVPDELKSEGITDVVELTLEATRSNTVYLSLSNESPARAMVPANLYRARHPEAPINPPPEPSTACEPDTSITPIAKAARDWIDWNDSYAHDKGCGAFSGERVFHARCEALNSISRWSTECPDMRFRRFNGWGMTRPPQRLPDRAWTEVYVKDPHNTCSFDWATRRLHDKGCQGSDQILHVRCELTDGSPSLSCPDMRFGTINYSLGGMDHSKPMTRPPARLPDAAWMEVAVACDNPQIQVQYAWNEAGAHDKGCVGGERFYHVRCEQNGNGAPGGFCPDMPRASFKGVQMARAPARLPDRAWTEVALADSACPASPASPMTWATGLERAHDKGCRGGLRYYHVRCEFADGSWSDKCSDMAPGQLNGVTMLLPPRRLSDRAWTEVAVACTN